MNAASPPDAADPIPTEAPHNRSSSPDPGDRSIPVIKATHLSKHYGAVQAVKDVSFTVQRRDVFGFLGPNGSGKSTTISMMLGLVTPTSGQVELFGFDEQHRSDALTRVGAIIESPTFYPYLSGRDNLRVLAQLRPGVTERRISDVLETIGLADSGSKHYNNYSLGMKQRLAIGATLLHDPELLMLDEPTNGLDPAGMLEVRHLIQRLAANGKTIFLSSHLLSEVEQVCNRVAILSKGEIMAEGTIAELAKRGQAIIVRVADPQRATEVLGTVNGVTKVELDGENLVVSASPSLTPEINVALVQAGIAVFELRPAGNSLEQVFLSVTGMPNDQRADALLAH
jgi:ABC-2 type transport system ATP-binding protein